MKKKLFFLTSLYFCLLLSSCAHNHMFSDWTITTEATCTQEGQLKRTCECGEVEVCALPILSHNFGDWLVTTEATCTTEGRLERACECGAKEYASIPIIDHNYDNEAVLVAATCTTEGTNYKTCTMCNAEMSYPTPILGHSWKAASCVKPKTCSACGLTEGTASNHRYSDATCTSPQKCTSCGKTQGSALGCTAGSNGRCIRCNTVVPVSSVLSAPLDAAREISSFVGSPYEGQLYYIGNYRLAFYSDEVYLYWGATNISSKTIKQIECIVRFYDSWGSDAYDDRRLSFKTITLSGPIDSGKSFFTIQKITNDSDMSIYYGEIFTMIIHFSDGTKVTGRYEYPSWHDIRTTPHNPVRPLYIIEK